MLLGWCNGCGQRQSLRATLARGLKHDDGSGCGHVEGGDGSGHRNAQQVVAGAADEIVQAVAFASENDYCVGREVVMVVTFGSALIESDAPDVVFFQLLKSANKVDDSGDTDVFGGSGGGFNGDGAKGRGTAFCDEDTIDARSVGSTEERAEVLWVFDSVEGEKQARFGAGQQVFEIEKLASADDGDNALVGRGVGQTGELFARFEAEADIVLTAGIDEALEALVMTFTGDADVVKAAATGAQSLLDGVQAVQNFHPSSINCRA